MSNFQFRPLAKDDGKIDSRSYANLMLFCGTNSCCICHLTDKRGVDRAWNWNYAVAVLGFTKILNVIIADEFNDNNGMTDIMTLGKLLVACIALEFPSSAWNPIVHYLFTRFCLWSGCWTSWSHSTQCHSFIVRSRLILLFYKCENRLPCSCVRCEYRLHNNYSCVEGTGSHTGRAATNICNIFPFLFQVCPHIRG
jgi:hypothetical protein